MRTGVPRISHVVAPALIAAGILGVPVALLGRAPAPPQPAPALPGISETIDVRVVNVEVVVADRGGHLVHGLTAADFRLEVDGKEVPIDYFTEVREGQAAAGAAPAGASQGAPTAPVPPNLEGHFQVTVPSSPQPGGTTYFSTRVELRRLRHHIVVGLSDAQTGDIVTGELEIRPPA